MQIHIKDEGKDAGKRKANTVHHNDDFEATLHQRRMETAPNFQNKNIQSLRAMSTGKPPKERLYIPDDVEVFFYGNQKLNIWEV